MHLSSTDPNPSPRKRGSTHKSMFVRQLSSISQGELPGIGKHDEFGSKDLSDHSHHHAGGSFGGLLSPSIKMAAAASKAAGHVAHKLRPTGRLKAAVKKLAAASEITTKLKDQIEDKKMAHTDVLPPPKCLNKYLLKSSKDEKIHDGEQKNHIDAEEIYSSVQNVEYEEEQAKEAERELSKKPYQLNQYHDDAFFNPSQQSGLKAVKKFDKARDRFVFHLTGVLHEEKKVTVMVDEINAYTRKSMLRSSMLINNAKAAAAAAEPEIVHKEYVIQSEEDEKEIMNKYGIKNPTTAREHLSAKPAADQKEARGGSPTHAAHQEDGEGESSIFSLDKLPKHDPYRYGGFPYITNLQGQDIFITEELASKYFGESARITFFEQYRKMSYNKLNIAPSLFPSYSTANSSYRSFGEGDEDENFTTSMGDFGSSINQEQFQSSGSLQSPNHYHPQQLSILSNPNFYSDLQTLSSNDSVKHKIDHEILSKVSFGNYDNLRSVTLQRKGQNKKSKNQAKGGKVKLQPLLSSKNSTTTANTKESWDILNESLISSPRTKYLSCCIRESMKPLPNILIRKEYTTVLDLSHFGMGDEMGKILAECLQHIPFIESINLNDNNLTDASLQYLIEAIIAIPTVKVLNLSRNKIDGYSAEALSEYVSRPDCPLITLILQNADVDDGECDNFVKTLVSNEQLLELDLSSNLLGSSESLSTVDPNTKTGGEAIAEYIKSAKCRLKILKLAWNNIRLKSAWKLMSAISFNHTITYLDLNSNGLGTRAGEILGDAIMENRNLKTLLVNSNSFTSTACISLCIGVIENMALKRLEINENPIGLIGAKMIMQISMALGNRVALSAKNCNTVTVDADCWYDPSYPSGDFTLRLNEPFERAIAFHLLQVVASHATYIFDYFYYEPSSSSSAGVKGGRTSGAGRPKGKNSKKLNLIQSIAKDREQFLDPEQLQYLHGLKTIYQASTNLKLAEALFLEADEDQSGKLDKYELQNVLNKIGFHIEFDHLQDLILLFDIDGTGMIDKSEFLALLKSQQREALARIKELTEYPIMALETSPTIKYIPPKQGIITCKIIDGFIQKAKFYTMSSLDSKYAQNMAKGIGDMSLLSEAVKHNKIRYNEALQMFKTMYKQGERNKSKILLRLLPQMMYTTEAIQLISKITNDNYLELQRIKLTFGISLKPLLGLFNGYYILDLSKEIHRICLSRLFEQSQNANAIRQQQSIIRIGKVGDTSQHQNWTCFRNEIFNGEKYEILPQKFTPMPHQGILSFDFTNCQRPSITGELAVTDKRLCKVLNNLCLLKTEKFEEGMKKLQEMKQKCLETSKDRMLFMPTHAINVEKALEIGRAMDNFYGNVEHRELMNRLGMKKEEIKVQVNQKIERPKTEGSDLGDEFDNVRQMIVEKNKTNSTASFDELSEIEGDDLSTKEDTEEITVAEEEEQEEETELAEEREGGEDELTQDDVEDTQRIPSVDATFGVTLEGNEGLTNAEGVFAGDEKGEKKTEEQEEEIDETMELTADQQIKIRKKRIKEQKHRLYSLLNTRGASMNAKAIRFVEIIDETFNRLWIYCRHLTFILDCFQKLFPSKIMRTEYFGSYSAEIVINLFTRIIDLHNFEMVLHLLSPIDCAAVFCRIGLLNIYNPLKPETTLELCLSRVEERMIAKMIIYLSVLEPGINLVYKRFQWKRELDPTPGWEVTDAMFTEAGLHLHGYFATTYYSGEGKNKMGCLPDIFARRALCQMVLIDENEVYANDRLFDQEDDTWNSNTNNKSEVEAVLIPYVNSGKKHFEQNQELWMDYLTANSMVLGAGGGAGGSNSSVNSASVTSASDAQSVKTS